MRKKYLQTEIPDLPTHLFTKNTESCKRKKVVSITETTFEDLNKINDMKKQYNRNAKTYPVFSINEYPRKLW